MHKIAIFLLILSFLLFPFFFLTGKSQEILSKKISFATFNNFHIIQFYFQFPLLIKNYGYMFGLYIYVCMYIYSCCSNIKLSVYEEEQEVAKKSLPLALKTDFALRAVKMS
ncbi:hypothetical protein ACKWTF_006443 [Chironomus riparius]